MIDINKKYKTKSGSSVELITINGRGDFPVIGYVGESDMIDAWGIEGNHYGGNISSFMNLVEEVCPFESFKKDEPILISVTEELYDGIKIVHHTVFFGGILGNVISLGFKDTNGNISYREYDLKEIKQRFINVQSLKNLNI